MAISIPIITSSLLIDLATEMETCRASLDLEKLSGICREVGVNGHLAILNQPYLDRIVAGHKTVESRFSKVRSAPYHKIHQKDVLILKEAAGLALAIASVSRVEFFGPMLPGRAGRIMEEHSKELVLEKEFMQAKQNSIYATLIYIDCVLNIEPLLISKVDRRSWIVLNHEARERLF